MGLCNTKDKGGGDQVDAQAKLKDKTVANMLNEAYAQDSKINKLLLLGAGESGKSTLFKQMIILYGEKMDESYRMGYDDIISNNIITAMKTLCTQSAHMNVRLQADSAESKLVVDQCKGDEKIDETLAAHIQRLWADPGVQHVFDKRAQFQLTDSANYFFGRLDDIQKPDYIPSEQDVLRSRVRTTGIVENSFEIDGNKFKMFDVGGQRNERKKWIHCFENVTAVLFVAAISEYDQMLYEDENTNRIIEALELFDEICNSRWFRETAMILFLNKSDLFQKKIQKVTLRVCFPEYDGEDNYKEGSEYLRLKFMQKNRTDNKVVYTHVTCATNTQNVQRVFDAVKDIIIRTSLKQAGLLG